MKVKKRMEQDVEQELCDELAAWCKKNGLPESDLDRLMTSEGLTDDQYEWLTKYSVRWNEMIDEQYGLMPA